MHWKWTSPKGSTIRSKTYNIYRNLIVFIDSLKPALRICGVGRIPNVNTLLQLTLYFENIQ